MEKSSLFFIAVCLPLLLTSCGGLFVHPDPPTDYPYSVKIFVQDELHQPIAQAEFRSIGIGFGGLTDAKGCGSTHGLTGSPANGKPFKITVSAGSYKVATLDYISNDSDYFIVSLEKETSSASSVVEKSASEIVQGKCSTM